MYKVAVVTSVGKESLETLEKLINQISNVFLEKKSIYVIKIILSTDDYTPLESQNYVNKLAKKYKYIISNHIEIKEKGQTFARTYLSGFEKAISNKFNCIVEMDVATHDPKEILKFVEGIQKDGYDCVFSTRFSGGGSFKNIPKQRILVSKVGTILANICYGIYPPLPDLTSGYEAFSVKFVKKLFLKSDINKWVSVNTIPHLIQTELRVLLMKLGAKYKFISIKYGSNKQGTKLKLIYLYKATKGFVVSVIRYHCGKYWII